MSKTINNDKSYYILLLLSLFLIVNISIFFFIKNETHNLYIKNTLLDKNIIEEQRRMSIARSNFNKKYNINSLQELADKHLKLHYSTIKQVRDINDIKNK